MISEALEFLRKQFTAAVEVRRIDLPDGGVVWISPDGESYRELPGVAKRLIACSSLADFIASVTAAKLGLVGAERPPGSAFLSISNDRIWCCLREGSHEVEIGLALSLTKPAAVIESYASDDATGLEHRDFLRLLRTTFRNRCDPTLAAQFAKVSFLNSARADSAVDRGRDSFGKQVEAAVANAADLPESFLVSCELFAEAPSSLKIDVQVYIDLDRQRFLLWVDSSAFEEAKQIERNAIARKLATAFPEIPLAMGSASHSRGPVKTFA